MISLIQSGLDISPVITHIALSSWRKKFTPQDTIKPGKKCNLIAETLRDSLMDVRQALTRKLDRRLQLSHSDKVSRDSIDFFDPQLGFTKVIYIQPSIAKNLHQQPSLDIHLKFALPNPNEDEAIGMQAFTALCEKNAHARDLFKEWLRDKHLLKSTLCRFLI